MCICICTITSFRIHACEGKALILIFSLPFRFDFPFRAGGDSQSYGGRVISVKWGNYTRRIGIDGTAEAIKEAIKSAFRLRTKRAFWLEDEDQIVRSLDRDMPLGNYMLQVDEGIVNLAYSFMDYLSIRYFLCNIKSLYLMF